MSNNLKLYNGREIAWSPLPPEKGTNAPMSSQEMFLRSEQFGIREVLFTGTTGNGKTETMIVHPLLSIGLGHGANLKFLFVKPTHASMDEIVSKMQLLYPLLYPGAKFYNEKGAKRWVFPDGEVIYIKLLNDMKTYQQSIHGLQFAKIYWDEATTFDWDLYEIMKTRLRFVPKRFDIPTIMEQMVLTTNPWGDSKDDVYNYFIRGQKYSVPQEIKATIKDRETGKKKEIVTKRMAIFGSWRENIYLSDEYVAMFEEWKVSDPEKYKALAQGRWDTTLGGMFEHVFEEEKVKIEDFILPKEGGVVFRSMDWGSTDPYSISYWYECNGGEVLKTEDGQYLEPPKNTLILFAEMYGGTIQRPNDGNEKTGQEVALDILEKEKYIREYMFDDPSVKIKPGPADTQIFNKIGTQLTIYDEFKAEGVKWKEAKKGPGSRVAGLNVFKTLLKNTNKRDPKRPWILVFESCEHFFNNIPNLQRDDKKPDDVKGCDHKMDDVRYAITWKRPKSSFGSAL